MGRYFVLGCVLAGFAGPCLAAGDQPPGTISATATATDRLANTVADIRLGVAAQARTVGAAQQQLTAGADKLLAYLREKKVDRLRTETVSVTPQTDSGQGRPDRILGYDARMRVTARIPAAALGDVLAGALDNGANTIDDTSVHPAEKEADAARLRLQEEAVREAMGTAKAVSEAAGRHLGAVRQIMVQTGDRYPRGLAIPAPMSRVAAAPAPPIATEAGEATVSATVSVTVDLVEP